MQEDEVDVDENPLLPLGTKWSVVWNVSTASSGSNACYQKDVSSMKYQVLKNKIDKKDKTLNLGYARKLSNTDNGDIDATMQNKCENSCCKNVHDTMIEIVQVAKWALKVLYREVNIRGFVGQNDAFKCPKYRTKSSVIWAHAIISR